MAYKKDELDPAGTPGRLHRLSVGQSILIPDAGNNLDPGAQHRMLNTVCRNYEQSTNGYLPDDFETKKFKVETCTGHAVRGPATVFRFYRIMRIK